MSMIQIDNYIISCANKLLHKDLLIILVATLQLAYQEGLAMLQKTQMRVSKLKEENEKLQAAIKDWSLQTAELTMDNAELHQEVGNLKRELRTGSISIDEHKELMDLLCQ